MKPKAQKKTSIPLKIETIPICDIDPHPRNVRIHDERNIQAIETSLRTFGQRTPIVLHGKYVIKGNGTLIAARRLKWLKIQVVRADALSEDQAIAYAIADNKTSDLSEFDFEELAHVLHDLHGRNVDLTMTGFQQFEIEPLLDARFDYKPGKPGEMPTLEGDKTRIIFTEAQWEIITRALEIGKQWDGLINMTAADALVWICKMYLDKKRQPNPKPLARKRI